LNLFR